MDSKNYDVYHAKSGKVIGYTIYPTGGLVYDPDGHNVVGKVISQKLITETKLVVLADRPHHTGGRYTGDTVIIDNKPSKRFTK